MDRKVPLLLDAIIVALALLVISYLAFVMGF